MMFKILLPVMLVAAASANQCNSGLSKYFLPFGDGTQDVDSFSRSIYSVKAEFNAFGYRYPDSTIRVAFGKDRAFGALKVFPVSGRTTAGSFELRASRARYNVTENTYVGSRATKRKGDMKKIAKLMNEAYPCVDDKPFNPVAAYIGTYQCVQYGDTEDTFQVILTSNNVRTYVILIFHTLSEVEKSQFGIMNVPFPASFSLVPGSGINDTLLTSTNGIRPGVWAFDITDGAPTTPKGCGKLPNECTVTDFGLVSTFDGDQTPITETKEMLLATRLDKGHPCQLKATVNMKVKGTLKYLAVTLGSNNGGFARTYALDQTAGLVMAKGLGLSSAQAVSLPHTWEHAGTNITISDSAEGYILTSSTCAYQVEYKPLGREPQIKVTVGFPYFKKTAGLCEKYLGDFAGNYHKGDTYFLGDDEDV